MSTEPVTLHVIVTHGSVKFMAGGKVEQIPYTTRPATYEEVIAALPECELCKHWNRLEVTPDYPKGFCVVHEHLKSSGDFCMVWERKETL